MVEFRFDEVAGFARVIDFSRALEDTDPHVFNGQFVDHRSAINTVVNIDPDDAVASGQHDVGVVHAPVDRRVDDGPGHEFVEPGGVQVRGRPDGAFLVGGVDDDPVERLSGDGEQADPFPGPFAEK